MDAGVMSRIGLTLNEQKTSIRDARREEFDSLGYTFGPLYWWAPEALLAARPSKKSLQRFGQRYYLLNPRETGPWERVRTTSTRSCEEAEILLLWDRGSGVSGLNRYVYGGFVTSSVAVIDHALSGTRRFLRSPSLGHRRPSLRPVR